MFHSGLVNTFRPLENDSYFADNIFKFLLMNTIVGLWLKFIEIISYRPISIGSNSAMVGIRRQAIIWSNEGLFSNIHMHHFVSIC